MRLSLLLALILSSVLGNAQIYNPVKWNMELKPLGGNEYTFIAKATIEKGWWVYSQHLESDEGPIATYVSFDEGSHFSLVGPNKESSNIKKVHDKIFEMTVSKFADYYTIEQKIKVTDPTRNITGYINFMTCNDERCLPPTDAEFDLVVPGAKSSLDAIEKNKVAGLTEDPEKKNDDPVVSSVDSFATGLIQPVSWSFSSEQVSPGVFDIFADAEIYSGWSIYGMEATGDNGPVPASISLSPSTSYAPEGPLSISGDHKVNEKDKVFKQVTTRYQTKIRLKQTIKTENPGPVHGTIQYMVTDGNKTLPVITKDFSIDLSSGQAVAQGNFKFGMKLNEAGLADQIIPSIVTTYQNPEKECGSPVKEEGSGLIWMFVFGMINGLLALLTPCVFPMIPLTVSFFTKDTKRKGWQNGLLYGASIIFIYVALGLLVTILFGAGSLNELSTNPIANTIFFIIFVVFAFSFFGFYEITLPSSWSNKSDRIADKGGLIGIFFMAATLAIVSFSCTGPLIGTALVEASSKGFLGPLVVMLGFSFALAVPFGLFAAFPSWLNSLPKSGGWMNSVKVILGFAELALAFKFLSVADMTAHWGFLRYELFMGIWVIIALGMAAYLFGLIRFPHDSPNRKISRVGAILGLLFLVLSGYLATGFFSSKKTGSYNALSMMSGLAPPAHYNFFKPIAEPDQSVKDKYASFGKCANNLDCFHDYYEGLAYAKEMNKPIFLDFTGYGCVNCRKTEEHIWVKDNIRQHLENDYVLVSLYADDKNPVGEQPFIKSAHTGMTIRTIGQKWSDFQQVNFLQNSQPLYVILSPEEKVLVHPRGYDPDAKAYKEFLECGLEAFREGNKTLLGEKEMK